MIVQRFFSVLREENHTLKPYALSVKPLGVRDMEFWLSTVLGLEVFGPVWGSADLPGPYWNLGLKGFGISGRYQNPA